MGLFKDIFGGESKTGLKASQAENEKVRGLMRGSTDQSKGFISQYLPKGMEGQRQAFNSIFTMSKQAPRVQLGMLDRASQDSQAAMLGGLDNYMAALYGLPVQQMQAAGIKRQPAMDFFQSRQMPNFLKKPIQQYNMNQGNVNQEVNPLAGLQGMRGY